jgi:2-iminobutanoate/2-iminopropanoate deaminase
MVSSWTKQVVDVPELSASRSRAYEQCVVAGPLVFVSGQIGYRGDVLISAEFEPQVRQTFDNIRTALQAAGAGLGDLVAMTVYLTDPGLMDPFLELRQQILGGDFATSTMVSIDKLYEPQLLVEISAIAVRPT